MIPVCMVLFGMGSCFAGNFEEFLAFIPLVIGITVAMGFDSLTGIGLVFCAAASGYAGAVTNPFTVGVAQGIAGLPLFSGLQLRLALFAALILVSIGYVTWYAHRIKKHPELSSVHEEDLKYNSTLEAEEVPPYDSPS